MPPFATSFALSDMSEFALNSTFKSLPISSVELSPITALTVESAFVSDFPEPIPASPEAPPFSSYPEPKLLILLYPSRVKSPPVAILL